VRRHTGRGPAEPRFTFAVVGHDEAETLGDALEAAFAAAHDGDEVCFVDSASTDDSRAVAARLGAEVVPAQLGKGRAVGAALARCRTSHVCLLDADVEASSVNLAARLRAAALETGADMVVGEAQVPDRRRSVTPAVYEPLVDALFPEASRPPRRRPLSGFRVLVAEHARGHLPPGYGVEAHLNVAWALDGRRTALVELGLMRGPVRGYANVPRIAREVAGTLLDLAVERGRVTESERAAWDDWAETVIEAIAAQPPPGEPDEAYLRRLRRARDRRLPRARAAR